MRAISELEVEGVVTVTRADGQRSYYRLHLSLGETGLTERPVSQSDRTSLRVRPPPVSQRDTHQSQGETQSGQSKQTKEADKEAGDSPAQPVLRFQFREGWQPKRKHREHGLLIGLTDAEMLG